jgi:glutathione S-transferase
MVESNQPNPWREDVKLYTFAASTTCRPIMFFAADAGIKLEYEHIDLTAGVQYQPQFAAVNPNCHVPVLEDGSFRLTESSAILKYLADSVNSPAYPKDLKARARVNEMMDWFNTGFYNAFGYGVVYPQVLDHMKLPDEKAQKIAIAAAKTHAEQYFKVLDGWLSKDPYVCGKDITIADYFGSGLLSLGEVVGCTLEAYPNVRKWYDRMQSRPNWQVTNGAVFQWAQAVKGPAYVRI